MAGLIIKELKLRGVIESVLVVVPGHLKDQWRRELKDKFAERTVLVDRDYVKSHYGENVWKKPDSAIIVTSMDFVKRDGVLSVLKTARFDMVIVDEAHKLSAHRYGQEIKKSGRYKLGEVLSEISEHLLFLTGTPHQGDPESFRLFLDLLQPGFFSTTDQIRESVERGDNPLFLRRSKEDMKDLDGKPLFVPRIVKTREIILTEPEMKLYYTLSDYVRTQYGKGMAKLSDRKKRNVAFALIIMQRRMASSTYALLCSLMRRKTRLEEILNDPKSVIQSNISENDIRYDLDDESESERWKMEMMWETVSVAENREELRREIDTLADMISTAKRITSEGDDFISEGKIVEFHEALKTMESDHPGDKILVFTESKDTLQYLVNKIKKWGYSVNVIHGGMTLEERVEAESKFKNETRIMVATEAAGEGINLQFCHLMINYDIPWNPSRLEQRMGRIHRYGQSKKVTIINMVAVETMEGQVLAKLFEKLDHIRRDTGSDKVFDVVSEYISDRTLSQLLNEAAAGTRPVDEVIDKMEAEIESEYRKRMRGTLNDQSLAASYMDTGALANTMEDAKAHKLNPEYTQDMFLKAYDMAGGKAVKRRNGIVSLGTVPASLRVITNHARYVNRHGQTLSKYNKVTFDKDVASKTGAEFIVFGHPLFEAILEWIRSTCSEDALSGAVFTDPDGIRDGHILFHKIVLKDATGAIAGKRLATHYIDINDINTVRTEQPYILWDLVPAKPDADVVDIIKEDIRNVGKGVAIHAAAEYMDEVKVERRKQARIKERYGVKSLDMRIVDLDNDIMAAQRRIIEEGKDMGLVIRNKKERKTTCETRLAKLKDCIKKEQNIIMADPQLVGYIRVVPAARDPDADDAMHTNPEMEAAGMQIAADYEMAHGWTPKDVSAENLGYDIRSRGPDGQTRYIEVKARSGRGAVELTPNEFKVSQNLRGKYYLYVVWHAATSPDLKIIPAPDIGDYSVRSRYELDPNTVEAKAIP